MAAGHITDIVSSGARTRLPTLDRLTLSNSHTAPRPLRPRASLVLPRTTRSMEVSCYIDLSVGYKDWTLTNVIFVAAQYNGQQGNFGGPQAGSPAGYSGSPMGYGGPQSAGGYGRGHQGPNAQWNQNQGQNFNNGFGGYQS